MPKPSNSTSKASKPASDAPGSTGDASRAHGRARPSATFFKATQEVRLRRAEEAIRAAGGVLAQAARALGISRQGLSDFVARHPSLRDVALEATEDALDGAEMVLRSSIFAERDWRAAAWFLERRGRHRGWGKHVEVADDDELQKLRAENRELRRKQTMEAVAAELARGLDAQAAERAKTEAWLAAGRRVQ